MSPVLRNLFATCAVLAVLAGGVYLYMQRTPAATTSQTLSDGTVVSGLPEGAVVTEIPTEQPAPAAVAPDYKKPVAYGPSVTAEVRTAIESQFAQNIAALAKNPRDFSAWMNLAILHKMGGDYRGAEAIWLYATKVWPTSPVAFNNLGDLYTNFLKDPAKAKFYFDQASKLGAGQ